MTRNQVIAKICEQFRCIDGRESPWNPTYQFQNHVYEVTDHYRWMDDVTNFPSVQCVGREETVTHLGAGERWTILAIEIRGFTYDTEVTERGETLADDLEHAIDWFQDPDVEDLRITSIQTDEGLNEPWGAVIIQAQAMYKR